MRIIQRIEVLTLAFVAMTWGATAVAQTPATESDDVWTFLSPDEVSSLATTKAAPRIQPDRFKAVRLTPDALDTILSLAAPELTAAAEIVPTVLRIPTPEGGFERFEVVESPVMHPQLQRWLADQGWPMRTFKGRSLDHPATTVRFDWGGPAGFHAMVLSPGRTYYVDPRWQGDRQHYVTYFKHDYRPEEKRFVCGVTGEEARPRTPVPPKAGTGTGGNLRTYRLAVAATGEYTTFHGGTQAGGQTAIVTTVNRVNQIYERDLSIRMTLIANNQNLVYTNGATDPYTNGSGSTMLGENQTNVDTVIGNGGYDIGHVVSTGGGGVAYLGVPCVTGWKAGGVTGSSNPIGDPFDVDFVAHEMGHQWGGNHTFNSETGSCGGGPRNASTAYEPGSGATIQAYAGICGVNDLQPNSDDFFHGVSLDEMLDYSGGGGACSVNTSAGNPNAPTVNAGSDYTIPVSTPFELTAAGNDSGGDPITYSWEEFDLGSPADLSAGDNGSSPIFRPWDPTTSPTRVFPRLSDLLASTTSPGETLPTTNRTMTFRVTVRDNNAGGGRVGEDTMTVTSTTSAGPFAVISPNGGESLTGAQTVTWNVAGTNAGTVSTANVDILLSTDGGATFPTTLASATANDGSAGVTLPAVNTSSARIKVKGSDNVFFDVSNNNFTIGSGTPTNCRTPSLALTDPGSVNDSMTVSSSDTIGDLDLSLEVTHSWVGDLTFTLEHVDTGTSVIAVDRPGYTGSGFGCGGANIMATLDDEAASPVENECAGSTPTVNGTFTPNNALSAFDGESLNGTWRLTVSDAVGGDSGTLDEWCLVATPAASGCAAPDAIFCDGFESGNTSQWSSSVP